MAARRKNAEKKPPAPGRRMSTAYGKPIADPKYQCQYPDPKMATPERWAWEFLRRNPSYQSDCEWFLKFASDFLPRYSWRTNSAPQATSAQIDSISRLRVELGRRWGLAQILPYERLFGDKGDWPPKSAPQFIEDSPEGMWLPMDGPLPLNRPHLITVQFNLKRPIDAQLRSAGRLLQDRQTELVVTGTIERSVKPREREYRFYLRALDAMGHGLNAKEAAALLGKQATDTVTEWLRVARRLRNGGYRDLLWLR